MAPVRIFTIQLEFKSSLLHLWRSIFCNNDFEIVLNLQGYVIQEYIALKQSL